MAGGFPQLDYIINADNFRRIQESLAEASDMAILTVDYKGTPVTAHSRCSAFCAAVRAVDSLNEQCRKCDSRGGLEAARLRRPYLYRCHMDLLDLAVPIVVDDHYLGAIMAGQVRIEPKADRDALEKIASGAGALDPAVAADLASKRRDLPAMSMDRVEVVARMLFHICNYIVEEALVKLHLMETYREERSARRDPEERVESFGENPIIKPALDYIEARCSERLTLEAMAARCNVSPSYFSKLFNKETGDNFSLYVNRVRVRKARELLLSGNETVTSIAMDLGFEDSGYFDKVFRKIVGMSPTEYRDRRGAG